MAFKTNRLHRNIHRSSDFSIAAPRLLLAQQRIVVDGLTAETVTQPVKDSTKVTFDGNSLSDAKAVSLMPT